MAATTSRLAKAGTEPAARRRTSARQSQRPDRLSDTDSESSTARSSPESLSSSVPDLRQGRDAPPKTRPHRGERNMKYVGKTVLREQPAKSSPRDVRNLGGPAPKAKTGRERRANRDRSQSLQSDRRASDPVHRTRKDVAKPRSGRKVVEKEQEPYSSSESERERSSATRKRRRDAPDEDPTRSSQREVVETRIRTVRTVQRRQSEPFSLLGPFRHSVETDSVSVAPLRHVSSYLYSSSTC